MKLAIGVCAWVGPGTEDRADRRPELRLRRLREGLAVDLHHLGLIVLDHRQPVLGAQFRVQVIAPIFLGQFEDFFKIVMIDAQHHIPEHLDEAAVAVVSEAHIAGAPGQALHGLVVEAQVEDRVHHPGHGSPRAGTNGNQQRVVHIAKAGVHDLFDMGQAGVDLRRQGFRVAVLLGKMGADLGGHGKARRHRQVDVGHLGKVCALAPQQIAHIGRALGRAAAKGVDPFAHGLTIRPFHPVSAGRRLHPVTSHAIPRQPAKRSAGIGSLAGAEGAKSGVASCRANRIKRHALRAKSITL